MNNLNIDNLRKSLSNKEEKPYSLNEEKNVHSVSIIQNICKNTKTKTSLSKLIQSIQNYNKFSGNVNEINKKPKQIHNKSYRNLLSTFSKFKKGNEEIDENPILKTPTISTITSSSNDTNKKYIEKKSVEISTTPLIEKTTAKISNNDNNLSVDQLISLESAILILLNKIRTPSEFHIECKEWKNTFEKNILGFFKEYDFINNRPEEMKYTLNILIISLIIAFWRTNEINLNNYSTFEIIIKEINEIMINHHKIYLLLCLWIIQDYKYSLNNNENISFLKNQINKNLPRKLNNCRNIYLIIDELSTTCNILHSILKMVLNENIELLNDDYLLNDIDNLCSIEMTELMSYFETLINEEEVDEQLNEEKLNELTNIDLRDSNNNFKHNYTNSNIYNYRTTINDSNYQNNYNKVNKLQNYPIYYYITDSREEFINKNISNNNIVNKNYMNKKNNYKNNYNINNYDNYYIKNLENHPYIKKQITEIPKPPFLSDINTNKYNNKKYTLVLDLDETLVQFRMSQYDQKKATLLFRPGLIQFLNRIYPLFDLVVWTVATKEYADFILDYIEKERKYFSARLYREHASINDKKIYVKNLLNLGRPLNSIIIVDDKESNYSLQKENGILIRPFYGTNIECQKDFVLLDLFSILSKIVLEKPDDVRNGIFNYRYEIQRKISNNLFAKSK